MSKTTMHLKKNIVRRTWFEIIWIISFVVLQPFWFIPSIAPVN